MNNKTASLLFVTTALIGASFIAPVAFADCYGGGCSLPNDLNITKQVMNPITNSFVDNLTSKDPTFSPGGSITYRLTVKNNSGETMKPKVEDTLPSFMTYESSTLAASYDATNRKVTIEMGDLVSGQSKEVEVKAKISDRSAFASDRTMFCTTNYAKVTAPARPNGDSDTSDACISTGASTLPIAGVNDLFAVLPFLGMGGIGAMLLKKRS